MRLVVILKVYFLLCAMSVCVSMNGLLEDVHDLGNHYFPNDQWVMVEIRALKTHLKWKVNQRVLIQ
jgi:hypothetical protein